MTNKVFKKVAAVVLTSVMCLMGTLAYAQNRPISGTVLDGSGQPVIGATVMVVGNSTLGTVTDADGRFSLSVPAGSTISVSCIGYGTQTTPVGSQSVFNFVLEEDNEFLEETVVIGYGVQRKSDLSGAVASVRSEDLKNRSTADAAAALQGKVSGVHVLTRTVRLLTPPRPSRARYPVSTSSPTVHLAKALRSASAVTPPTEEASPLCTSSTVCRSAASSISTLR